MTQSDFVVNSIVSRSYLQASSSEFFINCFISKLLRLDIYPDGGLSRLRLFGELV